MKSSLSLFGVSIVFITSCLVACGSSDEDAGGGSSGGYDVTPAVQALCAQQEAAQCSPGSYCVEFETEEYEVAAAVGCEAEHRAYLECAGAGQWRCEPSGTGGTYVYEPSECTPLNSALSDCMPTCSYHGVMDDCTMDCIGDAGTIEAECSDDGTQCSCTQGPNTGKQFTIAECDRGVMARALFTNCQ